MAKKPPKPGRKPVGPKIRIVITSLAEYAEFVGVIADLLRVGEVLTAEQRRVIHQKLDMLGMSTGALHAAEDAAPTHP